MTKQLLELENRTILIGDVLEQLKKIPDNSIDTEISSPPYWGLRDYGKEGQWGLEPDFRDYLKKMRELSSQLKRILKPTGSCWINLGDTYSGSGKGVGTTESKEVFSRTAKPLLIDVIEPKSRYGIPERFYVDCIDNGWIARNHIPWVKENPMPSSVKDRFNNKWESIFFFVKNQKYYFNLNAVREKPKTYALPKKTKIKNDGTQKSLDGTELIKTESENTNKQDSTLGADGEPKANYKGFNERWKDRKWGPELGSIASKHPECFDADGNCLNHPNGKNPGDVFNINPKPFPEAHFATFPIELPLKILKCSCPNRVCRECGKPREPIVEPTEEYKKLLGKGWHDHSDDVTQGMQQEHYLPSVSASYQITGWTDCGCDAGFRAGIVLDPFFGSGTVGCAAEELGLNWIGVELNQEYVDIARKRLDPYMMERLI